MRPSFASLGFCFLLVGQVLAQTPELADLKARLADPSMSSGERARRALQGAAALDQAAQQAGSASDRRAKWASAVTFLDEFVAANPEIEAAPLIRFQAAVYRWAEGQSFADVFEQKPSDFASRDGAIRSFDDAIRRFRGIATRPAEAASVFAQNLRFRLAQAIADRSKFEPEGNPEREKAEREALALLDKDLTTPGLRSFALLLKGQLCNRLNMFVEAQMEIAQAERLDPPPSAESVLEAKVDSLCGRRQFDEAVATINPARVGEPLKNALRIKLLLARRREKSPGRERREIDDQAFVIAEKLRGTSGPETRRALMELARNIDEPSDSAPPEWWDLLAEGHLRLGNPVRAGRLDGKGSDRAQAKGMFDKADTLRYKAAAYLFEAGKFVEADQRLTQVIESRAASKDLKARAGMLRGLARGRAIATQEVGASRDGYVASLETQVRDFPNEPTSGEARWLLGQIRLLAGKSDEAIQLWSGIPHGQPRWLESRLIIADRRREAVEIQRINRDGPAVSAKMEIARKALNEMSAEADNGAELAAIKLKVARLELIPEVGKPALALVAAENVLRSASIEGQHETARLYRMVALALANRGAEAEKAAQTEVRTNDLATLLPALRLLDRAASEAESELTRKRLGLISRVMTSRIVENLDSIPEKLRDEARLHHIRATLFSGDRTTSKKELASWGGFTTEGDDELLRELTDLYLRLEAYTLAVEAARFRASRLAPGSLPWFEAQYEVALASFRADRPNDAKKLIDATAILHPTLGGGELKTKFVRLRQKIGD